MKNFKNSLGPDVFPPKILALKYRFFCASSKDEFQIINGLIDSLKDELINNNEKKLIFGKYTQGKDKNLTTLKLKSSDNELLINQDSVKQLVPIIINMKLGDPNREAVEGVVQQLSPEFKSRQHSHFSKDKLDQSTDHLPQLIDKLAFLDRCYEEVTKSTNYTRRHAWADTLFSFFKYPLTTSQRQHICLLKNKFNEIIDDSQKEMDTQQRKEFQWLIKNRGSELMNCKTDRFYFHLDSLSSTAKKMG